MEETLETLKASDKGVDKKIKDNKESPTWRKRIVIAYDYTIVIIQNDPDAKSIYRKPCDAVAKIKANWLR